ncbi:MAG TPA: hypothetical protein PKD46_11325 [Aggregatilineaceae bacterium]|nr:hypothetical protein [Aggregatilineaceae bacterium]
MAEFPRFLIPFETGPARAVAVPPDTDPGAALAALDLPPYRAVVVVHGGASAMEPDLIDDVTRFFAASLAPFAEQRRVLVADGGTQAGTMAALGAARRAIGGTFPLVGVAPRGAVSYPGAGPSPDDRPPLDAGHSHFVLIEADTFGVESSLLVGLLRGAQVPGVALIVNGGPIVREEVAAHAALGHPVIAVAGSGRAADELADPGSALRAGMAGAAITIVSLADPPSLTAALERALLPSHHSQDEA